METIFSKTYKIRLYFSMYLSFGTHVFSFQRYIYIYIVVKFPSENIVKIRLYLFLYKKCIRKVEDNKK